MNFKTIITTAGLTLLSLSLTGTASAEDCHFTRAVQLTDSCWERHDSCGNVSLIGACYTSAHKPLAHRQSKKANLKAELTHPKGTVFMPEIPPACLKEGD
jgi:hypothetical protein